MKWYSTHYQLHTRFITFCEIRKTHFNRIDFSFFYPPPPPAVKGHQTYVKYLNKKYVFASINTQQNLEVWPINFVLCQFEEWFHNVGDVPGAQSEHSFKPSTKENFPVAHSTHGVVVFGLYFPKIGNKYVSIVCAMQNIYHITKMI